MKKQKLITKILIGTVIALFILYNVAANIMVSAALVPDFMRRLEAFEEVTEKSYSEMVRTDEITENTRAAREEAEAFLEKTELRKVRAASYDGYDLIAAVFKHEDPEGRPWVSVHI